MTPLLPLFLLLVAALPAVTAWSIAPSSLPLAFPQTRSSRCILQLSISNDNNDDVNNETNIQFDQLLDMDIVLFLRRDNSSDSNKKELGAVQEDGTIVPISVWTLEPAYDSALAFVVDEVDRFPGLTAETIDLVEILDERVIGYGSRQLFGGKGPGNPHGEESEQLYYVEQETLESRGVEIVVKPELEIQW